MREMRCTAKISRRKLSYTNWVNLSLSTSGDELYTAETHKDWTGCRHASHSNASNSCECLCIAWTRCCSHNSFHTSLTSELVGWIYSMEGEINIFQPGINGAIQYRRWGSADYANTITTNTTERFIVMLHEHIPIANEHTRGCLCTHVCM